MTFSEITAGAQFVNVFLDAVETDDNALVHTSWQTDPQLEFATSVARGLAKTPKELACRFLYDRRGSDLYERITEQPEYYPTRTEAVILRRCAGEIRQMTGPVTLVELGSGSSAKTGFLLDAYGDPHGEHCYVPIDVSESALRGATEGLGRRRPSLQVVAIHGTYEMGMRLMKAASPAMLVFLGSSIGNFTVQEEQAFWTNAARHLLPGDFCLLGVDLVKHPSILDAAYNDAAGVTEAFIKNILVRMNRELHTSIDVDAVGFESKYVPERQRVELWLRFPAAHTICVEAIGRRFTVETGERILVEISRKYQIEPLQAQLESHGFTVRGVFTDEKRHFAVLLLRRNRDPGVPWQ